MVTTCLPDCRGGGSVGCSHMRSPLGRFGNWRCDTFEGRGPSTRELSGWRAGQGGGGLNRGARGGRFDDRAGPNRAAGKIREYLAIGARPGSASSKDEAPAVAHAVSLQAVAAL